MPAVTKIRENETAAPKKERMLIGGKWVDSASGEWLEVEDPAHRRPIAKVPRGRTEDVARAVKAYAFQSAEENRSGIIGPTAQRAM
jgi:phenylacetaldehyde dehydrogenase